MKTTNYTEQANQFLNKTNSAIKVQFSHRGKHFTSDKEDRDIYEIELSRGSRKYSFKFGQSIANSGLKLNYGRQLRYIDLPKDKANLLEPKNQSALRYWIRSNLYFDLMPSDAITYPKAPTSYDILACLQKYDIGSFSDFCSEFGYDEDSKSAEKTYKAVYSEYQSLCALYSDEEMALMAEIQ